MKDQTRSFYEVAIRKAVVRIVDGLHEALDLGELSRSAALSPLHFHRIFRGMVGETPVELHRRLRLERAASSLASGNDSVTRIAFEAGYETNESFSRSFRDAYALPPSEFRRRSVQTREAGSRPPPCELAARLGLHFTDLENPDLHLSVIQGESPMNVDVQTLPEKRAATVTHTGPYNTIFEACARLGAIAEPAGLLAHPCAELIAIYHDDPEATPPSELRSEAGIVIPSNAPIPPTLAELKLPAGKYARTTHIGPYTLLGDTWARLMGEWLPRSGYRVGAGASYEVYRNHPGNARPNELRTDLYVPLDGSSGSE